MSTHLVIPNSISIEDIKKVFLFLGEIKYGSITLILQNGKVVQVEKQEKIKLT
jgi:hypothetical protein